MAFLAASHKIFLPRPYAFNLSLLQSLSTEKPGYFTYFSYFFGGVGYGREKNAVPLRWSTVFLLTEFAFDSPAPRERYNHVKDDHSDPILMTDLIYAFSGSENYGSAKDTSNYKECKFEGGVNIPFNQVRLCSGYDQEVRERYGDALKRMDKFVGWHLDPGAKDWFVKAVLDIIENDSSIKEDTLLYIQPDGIALTKTALRKETDYDLPAFLVGVLHFITNQRREQNGYGIPTLDSFTEKKNRKPRKYNGHLGEAITRTVNVDFLPNRKKAVAEVHADPAPGLEPDDVIERTDDEVINGAMMRTARAAATVLGAVPQPKINAAALGDAIAPLLVAAEACKPNEEVLAKAIPHKKAAQKAMMWYN